ncbi:hypothetical protein B0E49_03910 [Polaromonas sp. C04]|nr:hypothetical protein B0E49_03910 [Polaromonas sp. C04]
MGQELSHLLGVNIIVTNRPGAGGSIGTELVMRAPKDGYMILYAQNSALTIRRVLEPKIAAYDPSKDLTPLALTTRSPSVLVARTDANFKNFKEMVMQAKNKSGKISIGNAGPGSAGDISVQLISSITKVDIESVNYKGAAPAIGDLLGGHINGVILALGAVSSHIRAGTLRGLAISSPFADFPDIPTLGQLGYKQELQGVWFAFFMPKGVPKNVSKKIILALEAVARDSKIAEKLRPMGIIQEWTPAPILINEMQREYSIVQDLFNRNHINK